jgi:UDP-glucose 4-epimerase
VEKVLITGISGGQGRLLARRLLENYEVCGVDRAAWEGHPQEIAVHTVDLRKKRFEDVIRTELPTAVIHMGFIRHFRAGESVRHDVNVRGTKQLLDHCVNHGVQALVVLSSINHGVQALLVLSSSYVYGAFPENPYYMDEDSPLSASRSYPEIRDLVEVDTLASAFLWRYPHIRTCVLRPVNVLGYYVRSMVSQYLRESRIPTVMGFDPMMQFIHEEDLSEAIALALEHGLQGVFNVTGPGDCRCRSQSSDRCSSGSSAGGCSPTHRAPSTISSTPSRSLEIASSMPRTSGRCSASKRSSRVCVGSFGWRREGNPTSGTAWRISRGRWFRCPFAACSASVRSGCGRSPMRSTSSGTTVTG